MFALVSVTCWLYFESREDDDYTNISLDVSSRSLFCPHLNYKLARLTQIGAHLST